MTLPPIHVRVDSLNNVVYSYAIHEFVYWLFFVTLELFVVSRDTTLHTQLEVIQTDGSTC